MIITFIFDTLFLNSPQDVYFNNTYFSHFSQMGQLRRSLNTQYCTSTNKKCININIFVLDIFIYYFTL